jgi:hypothetical protein
MAVAGYRGRKNLARDHVAIGRDRIPEWIEALEFRINPDILRTCREDRATRQQDKPENKPHEPCLS